MKADWSFQWQHDELANEAKSAIQPKFNYGDIANYDGERVTIKNVRRTAKNTFTYDVEEYPHMFLFEHELEEIKTVIVMNEGGVTIE